MHSESAKIEADAAPAASQNMYPPVRNSWLCARPLHTYMISELIKKIQAVISCHFPKKSGFI